RGGGGSRIDDLLGRSHAHVETACFEYLAGKARELRVVRFTSRRAGPPPANDPPATTDHNTAPSQPCSSALARLISTPASSTTSSRSRATTTGMETPYTGSPRSTIHLRKSRRRPVRRSRAIRQTVSERR